MHGLIRNIFLSRFDNPIIRGLSDSAILPYKEKIAFTTDSFVVNPVIFPGGDIGKLAVCGSVNDLVVSGARPEFLSLGIIAEEGLEIGLLEQISDSIAAAARKEKVSIVTGDFKVVEKGACDKIFINTCGVGRVVKKLPIMNISPHDKVIVSGNVGSHGMAVLSKRKGVDFGFNIKSDCAGLGSLLLPILAKSNVIKFMRDPTRGGIATTLNEIARARGLGIVINEKDIPVSGKVRAASELLGLDVLYLANEGAAVIIVENAAVAKTLRQLRKHPLGRNARVIGEVTAKQKGHVILNTSIGTQRIIDMLAHDPLPRIC